MAARLARFGERVGNVADDGGVDKRGEEEVLTSYVSMQCDDNK